MRLREHGIWLLGASLAPHRVLADGGSLGGGQTVTFNVATQFLGDGIPFQSKAVFSTSKSRTFSFTSSSNITVSNVFLRLADDGSALGSNPDAAASPSTGSAMTPTPTIDIGGNVGHNTELPKSSHDGGIQQDQMIGRRDVMYVAMTYNTSQIPGGGTNGEIIIPNLIAGPPLNPGDDHSLPAMYYNKTLYLEVDWSRGTAEGGKSFSRYFAVAKPGVQLDDQRLGSTFTPQEQQPTPAASTSVGQPGLATATPGANPSSGPASASASAAAPLGLSTGAIAGIAVGCGIVGLALAALLVFFLVRYRRNQAAYHDGTMTSGHASGRPYGAGAGGHHRTADLIAEKEATAGVTETPHSPYSDDGQPAHAEPNGSAATAMLRQGGSEREYAPYSDQAAAHDQPESHQTPPADHGRSGSTGGAQTPQLGGRYAHLVEEGMTSDEIARIEEEERQLDAAIEQAARH